MRHLILLSLLLFPATVLAGEAAFVRGQVRDSAGEAIPKAQVFAVAKSWPGGRFSLTPSHATTDRKGQFALKVLDDASDKHHVNVAVVAEGYAFESRYAENPGVFETDLKLAPAHPVTVQFVDQRGKPLPKVTAWVSGRTAKDGREHILYPQGTEPIHKRSDRAGKVSFADFAVGDRATIKEIRPGANGFTIREFVVRGEKDEAVVLGPKGEVAEETLTAGKNERMQYFLFGPKPDETPGKDGYGLILVLPGGSGDARFKGFVKAIYERAAPPGYVLAELVAFKWTPGQEIVWPTDRDKVRGAKFTTEEYIDAVVKDVSKRHEIDKRRVLTLSWSSGGPAAYAAAFRKRTPITGSLVAMSVFYRNWFPSLKAAKGRPFYLLHSPEDTTCRFPLAEDARDRLKKAGATVEFKTYEGGHGWPPTVHDLLSEGFRWLDKNLK